jgi:hypothetical protein
MRAWPGTASVSLASLLLLVALSLAVAQAAEPIAIWTMEAYDGDVIKDATGHGHDATVHTKSGAKPKLVPGLKGMCLELDAADEPYLEAPDAPDLDPTEGFTAMAWIKPKERGVAYEILCKRGDPNKKEEPGPGWRFRYGWSRVILDMGDNRERLSASTADWSVPPDFWTHVAVTFDGKSAVRFYLNAVLDSEQQVAGTFVPLKRPLIIANYIGRKNAYAFHGWLDDVKLFQGVLSQQEIFEQARLPQ